MSDFDALARSLVALLFSAWRRRAAEPWRPPPGYVRRPRTWTPPSRTAEVT